MEPENEAAYVRLNEKCGNNPRFQRVENMGQNVTVPGFIYPNSAMPGRQMARDLWFKLYYK